MRRAEWRPLVEPTRGRTLLRIWLDDRWMSERTMQGAVVLDMLALLSPIGLAMLILFYSKLGPVFKIVVVPISMAAFMLTLARRAPVFEARFKVRAERTFADLLPNPLPEGTFPVYVALRDRGVPTGFDHAAASFVEGWLYVDGSRTSFALRAGEGRSEWRDGTRLHIDLPDGQSVSIRYAGGLFEPARFGSVGGPERFPSSPQSRSAYFRHAATLWVVDRDHPEGESILPPNEVYPALRARRRFFAGMSALVALGLTGLLVFAHVSLALAVGAGLGVFFLGGGWRHLTASLHRFRGSRLPSDPTLGQELRDDLSRHVG